MHCVSVILNNIEIMKSLFLKVADDRLKSIINNETRSNHKVDETFSKLKLSNEKKVCFEDDIENKRVEKELASEMVVKTNDDANNKPSNTEA